MRTLADIKEEDIPSLTAGELKALLQYHQINYTGCFEKGEFVQLALQAKRQLAPPDATPAIVPYFGRQDKKTIDYYAILGVEKTAAISEITRAYYKLARVNHPVRYQSLHISYSSIAHSHPQYQHLIVLS